MMVAAVGPMDLFHRWPGFSWANFLTTFFHVDVMRCLREKFLRVNPNHSAHAPNGRLTPGSLRSGSRAKSVVRQRPFLFGPHILP